MRLEALIYLSERENSLVVLPAEALAFENKSINDAQVRERSCQMVTQRREPAAPWGVASEVDPNFFPWVIFVMCITGILEPYQLTVMDFFYYSHGTVLP